MKRIWTPQGECSSLDCALYIAARINGVTQGQVSHIAHTLHLGFQPGTQWCTKLLKQLDLTVHQLYLNMQANISAVVRNYMNVNNIGKITVAYDGCYSNRNNNSDHAVETFMETTTPWHFALHIETADCHAGMLPQSAGSVLVPAGVWVIEEKLELAIGLFVQDGKVVAAVSHRPHGLDPWHEKNGLVAAFHKRVMEKYKCEMGDKEKGVYVYTYRW